MASRLRKTRDERQEKKCRDGWKEENQTKVEEGWVQG